MFTTILSNKVTGSSHTKCVSLNNQKCMIQPTLINLHPNEYSQKLYYSPLVVKLDVLETVILLIKYVSQIKQKI